MPAVLIDDIAEHGDGPATVLLDTRHQVIKGKILYVVFPLLRDDHIFRKPENLFLKGLLRQHLPVARADDGCAHACPNIHSHEILAQVGHNEIDAAVLERKDVGVADLFHHLIGFIPQRRKNIFFVTRQKFEVPAQTNPVVAPDAVLDNGFLHRIDQLQNAITLRMAPEELALLWQYVLCKNLHALFVRPFGGDHIEQFLTQHERMVLPILTIENEDGIVIAEQQGLGKIFHKKNTLPGNLNQTFSAGHNRAQMGKYASLHPRVPA